MNRVKFANYSIVWYLEELSSRVVAESGRACDRFHLGKLILQGLKDAPDHILQVDGSTGKSENFASVLSRSVACAQAFKDLGLQRGDVIVLMAPNQLDLCIPYYAAFYLGLIIAPIDRTLQKKELEDTFSKVEPKVVFCQSGKAETVRLALDDLKSSGTRIVTFDERCEAVKDCVLFSDWIRKYNVGDKDVNDFKAADFDPEETIALLLPTSGSTGLPKQTATTHKSSVLGNTSILCRESKFPTPTRMNFLLSPLQWLSAVMNMNLAPILRYTLLMTPIDLTPEVVCQYISKYKPTFLLTSPTMLASLLNSTNRDKYDISSLELLLIGGSAVSSNLLDELKLELPNADICNLYGLTEAASMVFIPSGNTPRGSSGQRGPNMEHRLVDPDSEEDIVEPNKPGELWVRGPTVFKSYYKNESATKEAFSKDGWLKTGDIFYRDENWNFFFVDRMKLLLKYKNHQISPAEIQNLIRQHPAVLDVAVTSISDLECGDLPVACVVRRPGHDVTAQEIKDLVKENLADTKQLRGGVVFMDAIPVTSTTKVDYKRLKKMVPDMKRQ
ncbi:AMP-binding enzyme domain-containing protein [Phthorimaea operculella]|nr:AMP-binding enzyme domain-containing protein [Phthorimaea operculella]